MDLHRSSVIPFAISFLSVRTSNKFYFNRCIIPHCLPWTECLIFPSLSHSRAPRFHANLIGLNYSSSATLFRRVLSFLLNGEHERAAKTNRGEENYPIKLESKNKSSRRSLFSDDVKNFPNFSLRYFYQQL
jgi:hypothetical protein